MNRTSRGVAARLRRRLHSNDRGFGSVEFAVLAVVVLALIFTAIQVGLYFHARKVAQSAARQGVETGRQFGASEGDGVAQAQTFLARFGGSVQGASVSSAGSTAEEIRITVRGSVATLVPGLTLDVVQHADAPIERWTTP
ncbi:TadE/TadG family type IV pilus assembly protein [Streptomyces sp. V1I6]|uniref:TadE/TadG family type IV pilus assembly protein n=1 Tax=Streptomyces sp. V1I6 TaxID=3042273 RepID=UPI0027835B07|nr:TadE/TadG family type IV pilus assembly protein [Streptomyces sp. V1I6]MDQ0847653.1 Flp pilus assembly protein TadG [Streptomyces sp. V1I6]MDQ0847667.1 Flp pilus assembly protein TadG [Streptomyces sp. V1I6]